MASNPRIEDLRKRIEKDPGSRLFAQLAEELRKDGELEDAIRVAREGLQKHPNYPSARMTLGRALLDTGDWAAARTEFEQVLKGAPDNILASRFLAECLENLGDKDAALARYRATLAMAPGEKHVVARIQELERAAASAGAVRPPSPPPAMAAPAPAPPAPAAAPPPPIPLATVEGEMELETSQDRVRAIPSAPAPPAAATGDVTPIPLVEADEEFELEKPYESPATAVGSGGAPPSAPPWSAAPGAGPARPAAAPPPARADDLPAARTETPPPPPTPSSAPPEPDEPEFELEAPHEAPATSWKSVIRPLPPPEPEDWAATAAPVAEPVRPGPVPVPSPVEEPKAGPADAATPLSSPTLAELYFNQGFTDKAIEVYRELSGREPGNERLEGRLRELEALLAAEMPAPSPALHAASDRREAIERTISRLEGLLSAIRKG